MQKLRIYISDSTNVFYNLALEEYLVTSNKEDILLFYVNTDAVVIGKHQNPWKEVDLTPINKNLETHTVARRLSGGGTVFHDRGNINFSFVRNKEVDFVNFKEHIEPVSAALNSLGILNSISPRNDIFVNEHKISGNAEHVNSKVKRILHHGTLLYDSNIIKLNGSIKPRKALNIKTHAVDSVRSPVMNIRSICDLGDTQSFLDKLISEIKSNLGVQSVKKIQPENIAEVCALVNNKYTTWNWNFGHTPQFTYTNKLGEEIKVRKGKIEEIKSSYLNPNETEKYLGNYIDSQGYFENNGTVLSGQEIENYFRFKIEIK
ncbi:MAG: lipoate-protein ligase A [Bacteroidia bacterium]|jgi:lipoate-protein ligase A